ncbi:solute carrier family 23 protein, partial [Salmonella sp. s58867]|uniref:solute carrier family 23 protein n=1 Tax=Salmonella sp. s58867 TaxID=3159710 RepID=UPI00397F2F9C
DEVVGAYLVAAVLIGLIGITGMFDRLMRLIPRGVAYGMMAGILFQFGLRAFKSMEALPLLPAATVVGDLLFKRRWPRYHMVLVLALGLVLTVLQP